MAFVLAVCHCAIHGRSMVRVWWATRQRSVSTTSCLEFTAAAAIAIRAEFCRNIQTRIKSFHSAESAASAM